MKKTLIALGIVLLAAGAWFFYRMDTRNLVSRGFEHLEAKNYREAYECYSVAAERGDGTALFLMGTMHALGQGMPVNISAATRFYRQSCEKGHVSGCQAYERRARDGYR